MQRSYLLPLIFSRFLAYCLFILTTWFLAGCTDPCEGTYTYKVLEPVYQTRAELLATIGSHSAKPLRNTGKIYAIDQYILVNELNEGIHVIDNSNPQDPQNISFISIPGNVDMAVRNKVLFADAASDLITLDFSNPVAVQVLKHLENVFEPAPVITSTGTIISTDASKGLVVDYKERLVTEKRNCEEMVPQNNNGWMANDMLNSANYTNVKSNPGGSTGKGGSMARFTINGDYLYTVGSYKMDIFNVAAPANPQRKAPVYLGSGIETIFPYQDKLFIGSNAGMLIYSLTNPAIPTPLGSYSHLRACDPVVVDGNYAYVTLRTNTTSWCGGNANQLDVVDISNVAMPQVQKTYPMQNPHGLGLDKKTLFICEGNYGLKVFDASNPDKITDNQLSHLADLHAFDVIPLGNNLLVVGEDGFRQYDYSNPKSLKLLSKIPIAEK